MMTGTNKKTRTPRPTVMQRIERLDAIPKSDKAALAEGVSPYFRDRSVRLRINALQISSDEMLRSLEEEILALLTDPNSMVRDLAVQCLGRFHDGEGIRAAWLDPLLEDPEWVVQVETLESFAQIGDKGARPLTAKKLQDEHPLVRGYAAVCLADLKAQPYRKQIERALELEEDEGAQVRFAGALYRLGDEKQFPRILRSLSSPHYEVRCSAAHILGDLELTPEDRQTAIEAVSHAGLHALFRSGRTTMDEVETQLREQQSIA